MKLNNIEMPELLTKFLLTKVGDSKVSKMSPSDKNFLWNILNTIKPKKSLEIGVYSGGSAAIILNAIKDIEGAQLYSADIMSKNPLLPNEDVMFFVEKEFSELLDLQKLYLGHDISKNIDFMGEEKFDFAFIDTAHCHPCECLNLLTILPFMKEGAWVVLHDIGLFFCREGNWGAYNSYATKYIWDTWVGEKISSDKDEVFVIPNIGAIKVENLKENKRKLISLLFNEWTMSIHDEMLADVRKIIEKYYDKEDLDFYDLVIARKKEIADKNNGEISKTHAESMQRMISKKKSKRIDEITKTFGPLKKIKSSNGRRKIYIFGIKVLSYKS